MKIIKGDLIKLAKEGKFDVIIHGCNCFCTMGAGIALRIKNEFPPAFKVDCQTKEGDRTKLGSITYTQIQMNNNPLIIVNGYTQYHYVGYKNLNYKAIQLVFRKVKKLFSGKRIGYPKIGAGLAGGDWDRIEKIIKKELKDED